MVHAEQQEREGEPREQHREDQEEGLHLRPPRAGRARRATGCWPEGGGGGGCGQAVAGAGGWSMRSRFADSDLWGPPAGGQEFVSTETGFKTTAGVAQCVGAFEAQNTGLSARPPPPTLAPATATLL